jgi:ABC-type glycerol-3-phosphate transport system permease component
MDFDPLYMPYSSKRMVHYANNGMVAAVATAACLILLLSILMVPNQAYVIPQYLLMVHLNG